MDMLSQHKVGQYEQIPRNEVKRIGQNTHTIQDDQSYLNNNHGFHKKVRRNQYQEYKFQRMLQSTSNQVSMHEMG